MCAVVGEVIGRTGPHATLDLLFKRAGAPGEPPGLAHKVKWKHWLQLAGDDPNVDGLKVLALVLEEFMDLEPVAATPELQAWQTERQRVVKVLEEYGLRYYRGVSFPGFPGHPRRRVSSRSVHGIQDQTKAKEAPGGVQA